MKKLLALLLCSVSVAFAGDKAEVNGKTYYSLSDENSSFSKVSLLFCSDYRDTFAGPDLPKVESLIQEGFGTDSVLYCSISASRGEVSAYPSSIDYVVNGISYAISYGEYSMVDGDVGTIREGSKISLVVAFPDVQRGEPFTLYWGDDFVKVTLATVD